MTWLGIILALLRAIPTMKTWWDELVSAYVASQIAEMKEENRAAIRKAIDEHDQRDIEKALGNPNAGEHSHLPDSELRDSLPGVVQDPDKKRD